MGTWCTVHAEDISSTTITDVMHALQKDRQIVNHQKKYIEEVQRSRHKERRIRHGRNSGLSIKDYEELKDLQDKLVGQDVQVKKYIDELGMQEIRLHTMSTKVVKEMNSAQLDTAFVGLFSIANKLQIDFNSQDDKEGNQQSLYDLSRMQKESRLYFNVLALEHHSGNRRVSKKLVEYVEQMSERTLHLLQLEERIRKLRQNMHIATTHEFKSLMLSRMR